MILCDWNLLRDKAVTDRAFIKEVCELGMRLSVSLYEPLIERGVIDGVAIPEGAVTLIPGSLYREAVLPFERKLFEWARARGLWCFLHQCGDIRSQLALYPESGADCISIDTGVSIGEVYRLYCERLVTAGNVDVINTIFGGDPVRICRAVSECVGEISDPYRKYILMPSCDLPPDTPLHNVKEFLACADRTG
jgi:uroporphyrinogen decarboxylase